LPCMMDLGDDNVWNESQTDVVEREHSAIPA